MREVMWPGPGDGTVDDSGDAPGVEDSSNDPEDIDRDVGTSDEGIRGGYRRRYFSKYKDRAGRILRRGASAPAIGRVEHFFNSHMTEHLSVFWSSFRGQE